MQRYIIELFPDNTNCIETLARKEYKNLTEKYLRTGQCDDDFEAKFELLRKFLQSSDFRKLRKESEKYLQKEQKLKFIIFQEQGIIKYRIVPE